MSYKSLREAVLDLEKHQHLVRIREECDPHLVMPALQRRIYGLGGPALLFEKVKHSPFEAVSNLFGTLERSKFLFRNSLDEVGALIRAKGDPAQLLKDPSSAWKAIKALPHALPRKVKQGEVQWAKCKLSDLPQLHCWPMDGGPFLTLPLVYSEDPLQPGWQKSNLGMYRVQIAGNDFAEDECGLHYQIHRGIAAHHQKAMQKGEPFRVSIFLGGPPALTLAAVMPLPENIPELAFAGALGGRAVRLAHAEGHTLAADADFCIVGTIEGLKPEGPFGDHLGYYSLCHDFPLMKVEAVYHRKDPIFPFTVVGRPPQEDTTFGALIHELTGDAISSVLPGVDAVHAVDAAGVHPLLLATGSERYVPWGERRPMELLTQANAILGFGQTSLAKYLWIAAKEDSPPDIHDAGAYMMHILRRLRLDQDLHFHTKTTMDTLDYSGTGLNQGSKMVLAGAGAPIRDLCPSLPKNLHIPSEWSDLQLALPGMAVVKAPPFAADLDEEARMEAWVSQLNPESWSECPLLVVMDDAHFGAANVSNFLWSTFTRSNPSHDVYGGGASLRRKHWGCQGPLVIDARIKPFHAPSLIEDDFAESEALRIIRNTPGLKEYLG